MKENPTRSEFSGSTARSLVLMSRSILVCLVALIAVCLPSASADCSSSTDCYSCTNNFGCGWCSTTNTCTFSSTSCPIANYIINDFECPCTNQQYGGRNTCNKCMTGGDCVWCSGKGVNMCVDDTFSCPSNSSAYPLICPDVAHKIWWIWVIVCISIICCIALPIVIVVVCCCCGVAAVAGASSGSSAPHHSYHSTTTTQVAYVPAYQQPQGYQAGGYQQIAYDNPQQSLLPPNDPNKAPPPPSFYSA